MHSFALLLAVLLTAQAPVEDVQVRGNIAVPVNTIKARIQTKAGDTYDARTIQRDIRSIWALEAFEDIRVTEEAGPAGGKLLVFEVVEKPRIRSVDYKGLSSITQSDILKALSQSKATLAQGGFYDDVRTHRAAAIIKALLAEKGRQQAKVEITRDIVPTNSAVVTFKVDEGPKTKVGKIEFEGNTVFSDSALRGVMQMVKESSWLTSLSGKDGYHREKLALDVNSVRSFYAEHGFVRVSVGEPRVETRPTRIHRLLPIPFWPKTVDRVSVKLKIDEDDQYRLGRVTISGATVFPADRLRADMGLREGDIYNESLLREGFRRLKERYGRRGYLNFTPSPKYSFDETQKVVNLDIRLDEDQQFSTHRIAFAGNTTTRDKVIRREIRLKEGEVFDSVLWDRSLMALNQVGYFEEVRPEDAKVDFHPTEPRADILLKVKEKNRSAINFSGGASGASGSFLGFNYSTNNFLGFGETLNLNLQGGTRQSNIVLNFTEPYVADRPLALGFSVFHSNYRFDGDSNLFGLSEESRNYRQKRSGFNLSAGYPIKTFHRLGLTFDLNNAEAYGVNSATRDYFAAGGEFGVDRTRKFTPSYSYSTVNSAYFPTGGQSLTASLEYAGGFLGGNTNYTRPHLEYKVFKSHTERKNVFAFRFTGSHVRGFSGRPVPFYERFYPGGEYDIRGFDFGSLGPLAFTGSDPTTDSIVQVGGDTQAVVNLEYRVPLFNRMVTLTPFVDAGNAWVTNKKELPLGSAARFLPGTNSGIRVSTGVELGFTLPVLNIPLRTIFAWNPKRLDREFIGPNTGSPVGLREDGWNFKIGFGKTF
jgi:outer membrane protein insertion porin family